MSTTFETELRHRAEASVPRGLSLDVRDVLAAGRRRRRNRTSGALGACAVLLVGGIVLAGVDLAPPAPSAAQTDTIRGATTVEVAPGVRATTLLSKERTAAGGVWWDTGLVPSGEPAGLHFGLAAATDQQLRSAGGSSAARHGVSLGVYDEARAAFTPAGVLAWPPASSSQDSAPVSGWADHGDGRARVWNRIGQVSTKVPSPHAVLLVPSALETGPAYVELPTFRSPVDPDALLFAVTGTQPVANPLAGYFPVVVFVGSDGSVDLNGECDGLVSLESCSQRLGGALIPALLSVGANLPG